MLEEEKNSIQINRKELSVQQVKEKENFNSVVSKHRKLTKRPVYKQKKFYFFLFILLVITLLLYYADKEEQIDKTEQIEESH